VALVSDPGAPVAEKGSEMGRGPRTQARSHRIFSLSMALSTRVNSETSAVSDAEFNATYEQTVLERFFPSSTKTPKRAEKRRFESFFFQLYPNSPARQ